MSAYAEYNHGLISKQELVNWFNLFERSDYGDDCDPDDRDEYDCDNEDEECCDEDY